MSRERGLSLKRTRSSPTFLTPSNPSKRRIPIRLLHGKKDSSHRSRRRIFADTEDHASANSSFTLQDYAFGHYKRVSNDCWKDSEVKALVEFILFHSSEKWPSHHQKNFWEAAAMYTKTRAHTEQSRTGKCFIAYAHTHKCTVLV